MFMPVVTAGAAKARSKTLRVISAIELRVFLSMVTARSDVAVWTSVSCETTSTEVVAVATESVTFTGTNLLASTTMPFTCFSLKPSALTVNV